MIAKLHIRIVLNDLEPAQSIRRVVIGSTSRELMEKTFAILHTANTLAAKPISYRVLVVKDT